MSQFLKLNCNTSRSSLIMITAACFALAPTSGSAEELDKKMVQQELEMLKQRIADLERLLKQKQPLATAESQPLVEAKDEASKAPKPLQAATASKEKASEVANFSDEEPPKEKGTVEISTAGSTMTVGGQIRLDTAYNNPAGTSNFGMSASGIPSSTAAQGERGHLSMHAGNSRLWFKTHTPINGDALRTLIEIDFWGSAGNERVSNSHNIRLRHAYAEYAGFTIGQTNSTFMHSGTTPDLINDSTADVFVRQPLIRYTYPFNGGDFQVSLEQPETTLTDIIGDQIAPDDDRLPDLSAKLTWQPNWGQLSLSGVLRQLRIDTGAAALGAVPANVTDQAVGGALFASARINLWGADNLRLGYIYGNALGRYVSYNSFNDAAIDAAGNIHLQRAMAGFGAYQHWWDDNWHSSFVFTRSQVNNDITVVPATAFRYIQSYHANLLWAPLLNTSMGLEYIHATSKMESGEKAKLQRAKFSAIYKF